MLLELAIADAYGACFETLDKETISKFNNLTFEVNKHVPTLIKTGNYTDDCQMSIAIAEALLENDVWTSESLANRFVNCFQRDMRRGYTPAFYFLLENSRTGKELLSKIHGDSNKSGAAMRSGLIGLLKSKDELEKKVISQAKITHNSEIGIKSARTAAYMVNCFYYNQCPKKDLRIWLKENNCLNSNCLWYPSCGKHVSTNGGECVEAAICAIEMHNSLSAILRQCIDFGGDTDTVGAIALIAASCSKEIAQDLPENLIGTLENGKYGKDYIMELDKKLMNKYLTN